MTFDDKLNTWNGPEWIRTPEGDHIVYTKFKGRHADRNARIGYARPVPNGNWFGDFLGPDVNRKAPYGNETPGDPAPLLTYIDSQGNHYSRELTNPDSEQRLTDVPPSNVPIRNVRGARAALYPLTIGGVDQVHYRDFDTRVVEQLTFDGGMKREAWMWRAPEFGNELVFLTLVDNVELRVYRKLADPTTGVMRWIPIYIVAAPATGTMASPEPFVFNGQSYVVLAMTIKPYNFHSAIWISNIDSAHPMFRRVTDDSVLRARTEPEVFITNRGPMIYYNRFVPKIERRGPMACITLACSEGIYRADPGLVPQ
jgi:hypothetical protein